MPTPRLPAVLLTAQLITGTSFTGLRLDLLIVAIQQIGHGTVRLVASTALDFAASRLIFALSPLEHFKSHRPSILACSLLFLTLISDIVRRPSLWADSRLNSDYVAFTGLFTAGHRLSLPTPASLSRLRCISTTRNASLSLLWTFLISAIYRKTIDILHIGNDNPAAVTLIGR